MPIVPKVDTADQWHEFLHKLIGGDYGRLVEILGSPSEVIRVVLRDASDRTASQVAFESALEKIAVMWQPQSTMYAAHYLNLLDLVSAFTPPSALPKILAQFELVGSWPIVENRSLPTSYVADASQQYSANQGRIEEHAFLALEQYFPLPPASESPLFSSYKALLFSKIHSPLWLHCLRRILELSLLTPDDPLIVQHMLRSPNMLFAELLPMVISTRRAIREALITTLFAQVLLTGVRDQFMGALKRFNCELLDDEQYPVLRTPFEDIPLLLDKRSREFAIYATSRKPSAQAVQRILKRVEARAQ
jgi:hypothetical protein